MDNDNDGLLSVAPTNGQSPSFGVMSAIQAPGELLRTTLRKMEAVLVHTEVHKKESTVVRNGCKAECVGVSRAGVKAGVGDNERGQQETGEAWHGAETLLCCCAAERQNGLARISNWPSLQPPNLEAANASLFTSNNIHLFSVPPSAGLVHPSY
jgi:hypothetical protein